MSARCAWRGRADYIGDTGLEEGQSVAVEVAVLASAGRGEQRHARPLADAPDHTMLDRRVGIADRQNGIDDQRAGIGRRNEIRRYQQCRAGRERRRDLVFGPPAPATARCDIQSNLMPFVAVLHYSAVASATR